MWIQLDSDTKVLQVPGGMIVQCAARGGDQFTYPVPSTMVFVPCEADTGSMSGPQRMERWIEERRQKKPPA